MATAIRAISHEDRLSLVDHLDELRTRLIVSVAALAVAFGVCAWQNHALLDVINRPLDQQTQKAIRQGRGPLGQVAVTQQAVKALAAAQAATLAALAAPHSGVSPAVRQTLDRQAATVRTALARLPRLVTGNKPVTLGVGEPFSATLTVAFYFAVIFALPIVLFQVYSFVLPAFSPTERRVALPVMLMIPGLFIVGVLFGYFVVLPAAVKFLQNFNSDSFNVLVQAKDYYRFVAVTLGILGLVFQIPVGVIAASRAGLVTARQLRRNRRYAVVLAAVIAAVAPGDVVTMLLVMLPILGLFELSIVIAAALERRTARQEAAREDPPVSDAL